MKRMKRVLAVLTAILCITAIPALADDSDAALTYDELNGKKVAVLQGTTFDQIAAENFPDSEPLTFTSDADVYTALLNGKVDFALDDEPVARLAETKINGIVMLDKLVQYEDYGFMFSKDAGAKYGEQFNEYLAKAKAEGVLDELEDIWFGTDDSKKTVDYDLPDINGTIKTIGCGSIEPFGFYMDGVMVGYANDLFARFCKEYGYAIELSDMDSGASIAAVQSGKYDVIISCLTITDERKQSSFMTDPVYSGGTAVLVRSKDTVADMGFFESIKQSFYNNFIKENRWKLILSGIGTTVYITVFSALLGTVLAFVLVMLRRIGNKALNLLLTGYVRLMQGMPMVVLLMIMYYVVFGNSDINAVYVAVITFGLNLAAYGSEIMRSGIESIDPGQREAAVAIGFTENQAFFRFIFPQAAVRFMPVYKQELVSLVKGTSIVGYIAIQDLTKMSDIIRSRTFEAFFPLIVTAIIYFLMALVIILVMNIIYKCVDRRHAARSFDGGDAK